MTDRANARAEILARIQTAIGTSSVPSAAESWQAIPRDYRQRGTLNPSSCATLLEDRLHDYGAGVHHTDASQIASAVAAILRERSKQRMLVPAGLGPTWLPEGFSFVSDDSLSYAEMDACDGVLTGCALAIALTGTLVLCHGLMFPVEQIAGRRALTLVPDYHLCVVQASSVVETVPEAFHLLEPHRREPITFISGPSATADIEMTRIQGVHGPRTLDVLLVG